MQILNKKKKFFLAIIDPILKGIFRIISTFRLAPKNNKFIDFKPNEIKKILLIRTAYLGDIILTIPAIKFIKSKFPQARLFFLTSTAGGELLKLQPYIDELIIYNAFWFYRQGLLRMIFQYIHTLRYLRAQNFDLAIDFRGDLRDILFLVYASGAKHRISYGFRGGSYLLTKVVQAKDKVHIIDYHLELARAVGADVPKNSFWSYYNNTPAPFIDNETTKKENPIPELRIYLSDEERKNAVMTLVKHKVDLKRIIVGIHPGARLKLRQWAPERFAQLADILIEKYNSQIIFTGDKNEETLIQQILSMMHHRQKVVNLTSQTTIRQLAALIEKFTIFICNETGTLHLAVALGTPTISLFGPQDIFRFAPQSSFHIALSYPEVKCRPCPQTKCIQPPERFCLNLINVNDVEDAFVTLTKKIEEAKKAF